MVYRPTSPSLTDGEITSSIECNKNEDGTLDCAVYADSLIEFARGLDEVQTKNNVVQRSRHFGPQEDNHIEINFGWDKGFCYVDGSKLVCDER